ncbi:MAG: hypothetical protein ACRD0U_14680 [Acidimicrobiales bacterium]
MTPVELAERPALVRFTAVAATAVVVIGLAVVLASGEDRLAADEARLTVDGVARVIHPAGTTDDVTGTQVVRDGDVVVADRGSFVLELASGTRFEGRARPGDTATSVRLGPTSELMAGDLLVAARRGADVEAAGTTLRLSRSTSGESAARISRTLAVSAGTYRGSLTLDSAGQERAVPALRSMQVAVLGRPPARPAPLELDPTDSWDQRFLGEAITLTQRLDSLSAAYTATLAPTEGRTAGFYSAVLPALADDTEFTQDLIDRSGPRAQGELLVGAAIANLGRAGSFADRWRALFSFFDEGAKWGLVALDQGVSDVSLLSDIEAAIGRTRFDVAFPAPVSPLPPPPAESPGTAPSRTLPPATSPSTTEPAPPTTAPTTDPPLLPPIIDPPPIVDDPLPDDTGVPLIEQLATLINDLLGGLLRPPPPGGRGLVGGLLGG